MSEPDLTLPVACGQLIVGGFSGHALPDSFRNALGRGERGGAILFRRNVDANSVSFEQVARLTRALLEASPASFPPLIGIDQEGGRVARLGPPVLRVPTLRALGRTGDAGLVRRVAEALGRELAALGFTMNFAPVLDVDTRASNPIIGDRSLHADPDVVAALGAAFASGLQASGVMACGKHFPGHGDTTVDSHLDLPRVDAPRSRLEAVELVPFRGLRRAHCEALMSAHVVYEALDGEAPATLSRRVAHVLLRDELGYDGLLVSDDLEMKAVADRMPVEQSAVRAVRAGCDLLLVCSSEELQARAHAALVAQAEADAGFRAVVFASAARGLSARRRFPPRPLASASLAAAIGSAASLAIARELEAIGAFA